jgi:hypothetical protein
MTLRHLVETRAPRHAEAMDIIFTTIGILLVVAAWPALVLYAANDSMIRQPRGSRRNRSRLPVRIARVVGRHSTPAGPAMAGRSGAVCR